MFVHESDQSFGLQLLKGETSQGTADFQSLRDDRRRDQLVRRDFFVQLVVRGCEKKYGEERQAIKGWAWAAIRQNLDSTTTLISQNRYFYGC